MPVLILEATGNDGRSAAGIIIETNSADNENNILRIFIYKKLLMQI